MKVIADTNILVRLIMADDEAQNRVAAKTMESASLVAISINSLCEFAWVLDRHYAVSRDEIARAIRRLIETNNVVVNRPAVEAGLSMLDAGGDFADGVIDFEGRWLGGETFVSFDKKAIRLLKAQGCAAKLLT